MPRALLVTPRKMATDLKIPCHNLAHFGRAKLYRSKFRLFQIPSPRVLIFEGVWGCQKKAKQVCQLILSGVHTGLSVQQYIVSFACATPVSK